MSQELKIRGFEPVKKECMKDTNIAYVPVRGDKGSAGYDISSPVDVIVPANGTVLIWSNLKAYMQEDEVLKLFVRSSLAIKKGLYLVNIVPIIDSTYYSNESNDGNIGICLKNTTNADVSIEKGERIVQGIFEKYLIADEDIVLKDKRDGGIGSSNNGAKELSRIWSC